MELINVSEAGLNIDYYYTDFAKQMVLNPYTFNSENKFRIENLSGKSCSHTVQIDATQVWGPTEGALCQLLEQNQEEHPFCQGRERNQDFRA